MDVENPPERLMARRIVGATDFPHDPWWSTRIRGCVGIPLQGDHPHWALEYDPRLKLLINRVIPSKLPVVLYVLDYPENGGTPVPPVLIHFNGIFHYKPTILGTPMTMETPIFIHVCPMNIATNCGVCIILWTEPIGTIGLVWLGD